MPFVAENKAEILIIKTNLKMSTELENKDLTSNDAKPMLCEVALRKRISKNRDEIDKWLNGDYPLDLVYMRIRMLSD